MTFVSATPVSARANFRRIPPITFAFLLLLALVGCSTFRAPQFAAPAGFAAGPYAAKLLDPATRADTYSELFPAPIKLHFAGDITASASWWKGHQHFSALYFAYRPGQQAPSIRLRGYHPQAGTTLFEILVSSGKMTVLFPTEGEGYQGPIPQDGSPFRARFGVEPWQLNNIFLIGRALAQGRWQQAAGGDRLIVTPLDAKSADVPTRIELDAKTGLPASATWTAGGQTYDVQYVEWAWCKDASPNETGAATAPQLMPKHLLIRRAKPSTLLDVEIDHYQFGAEVPPNIFTLYSDMPVRMHTLGELGKVLGN